MQNQDKALAKACDKSEPHEFWSKVVADQIKSKMSMSSFCKLHQLKYSTFNYWKYAAKIGRKICKDAKEPGKCQPKFIPLRITPIATSIENKPANEIKLIFNNGHQLILPQTLSEANLVMIIKAVSGSC